MNLLCRAFKDQRTNARRRSIVFALTFEEWIMLWERSGHLSERGRGPEQYVMARLGDAGHYAVGNIKIITNRENRCEQRMFEEQKEFYRRRMLGNINLLGHMHSAETKARIGAAGLGNKHAVGNKSRLGQKNSEESKAKMRIALLGNQNARKYWG